MKHNPPGESPPLGHDQSSPPAAPSQGLRILYAALGLIMVGGVLLNLFNVIGRYALGSPIFWAEEVLVGLTIWGVFIGAAFVSWRGDHLNMDLFYARLGDRAFVVVNLLIALTMVVICLFVAWQSLTILRMFSETDAVSAGAQIPKIIPHSALMIGFVLSAIAVLVRWRRWLFTRIGSSG